MAKDKKIEPQVTQPETVQKVEPTVMRAVPHIAPIQYTPQNSQTYLLNKKTGTKTLMRYESAVKFANKYPLEFEVVQF